MSPMVLSCPQNLGRRTCTLTAASLCSRRNIRPRLEHVVATPQGWPPAYGRALRKQRLHSVA